MVRRAEGVWAREDPVQPLEALERQWCLRPDHDGPGRREGRAQDDHDRRDLPESASHGLQPACEKGGRGRQIGRTKGGMNTKLHAVADANGRPIGFFLSAGPVSDYTGAAALLGSLPKADWLLADRGYDADWLREALKHKGMKVCIPGRKSRKKAVRYDKRRYKRRNRIEIMFGRLKDWRRVATRYDRCPQTFFSAIALAATVMFWL
uniref:Transposase, IS4 family n=1 Tax=Cereibacter sphaeroides (strain ATCC 17025 / ATH 2.4.3) TaxID=349102 RepID=A4WTL6_CERS5